MNELVKDLRKHIHQVVIVEGTTGKQGINSSICFVVMAASRDAVVGADINFV